MRLGYGYVYGYVYVQRYVQRPRARVREGTCKGERVEKFDGMRHDETLTYHSAVMVDESRGVRMSCSSRIDSSPLSNAGDGIRLGGSDSATVLAASSHSRGGVRGSCGEVKETVRKKGLPDEPSMYFTAAL